MESTTLGGTIRRAIRDGQPPACREGRVSRLRSSGVLEVSIRSLTGDVRTMPTRGYAPRLEVEGTTLGLLHASKGDAVWVTEDEGGQLVVVAWEPRS